MVFRYLRLGGEWHSLRERFQRFEAAHSLASFQLGFVEGIARPDDLNQLVESRQLLLSEIHPNASLGFGNLSWRRVRFSRRGWRRLIHGNQATAQGRQEYSQDKLPRNSGYASFRRM